MSANFSSNNLNSGNESSTIKKARSRAAWPITFAERQMAIEQNMDPESTQYNINFLAYRVNGEFDLKRFTKALSLLVKNTPILRSYYKFEDGEYKHYILDSLMAEPEVIPCGADEAEQLIERLNLPFDLARAPLFRCHILEHGNKCNTIHFCFHHIIIDGMSVPLLMDRLFELYAGRQPEFPEIDYQDFAVWQSENVNSSGGEAFFKEMFKNGVPETEMPIISDRPPELPQATRDISRMISVKEIGEAAKKYGVTKYELLMSAVGITLAKYLSSSEVAIGTALSGRTLPEQMKMAGMFVNTLPVLMRPEGNLALKDYIKNTAEQIHGVKANQTYPFENLVPILAPDRDASRSPVFDLIFNYLQEEYVPKIEGAEVTNLKLKRQALAIDIKLEAIREKDNIRLILSYSPRLYSDTVTENFMEQLLTVLERICRSDGLEKVSVIAKLPDKQKEQILKDFAGKDTGTYPEETVVSLFKKSAADNPDKIAVISGDEKLTYRELDQLSDSLAAYLNSKNIGKGGVVGIMVTRGLMMPLGALGALKAGAAYLPLDPSYPAERLNFMIGDANAGALIADGDKWEKVPEFNGVKIDAADVYSLKAADSPPAPKPEDLFILLYTSGTTGTPKGVMLTHANLVNFIHYYIDEYELTPKDKVPAYASFGFDACMMDMYPTLLSGAELHIIPEEMRLNMPGLREYFAKNGITVAFMTTQLGRQFAEDGACGDLRALSVGGEALVPMPPPPFAFYNVYGPTECTVFCTRFKIDKLYDRVPIGKATYNTALYVADIYGGLCPVGVAGELLIAGRQVSKGYLNRPELTEEKFTANPFSNNPEYGTVYHTGDIVRYLESGDIDFVGRRDQQVKIRGFRVELTEIEGRIREFEGVEDATVTAVDDAGGGKRIAAYITSAEPVDIELLKEFILEKLPPYMVPSAFAQIDKIPVTPNGKVDKRKLPPITLPAEEIIAPRTPEEAAVTEAAKQILKTDDIGVTTDLLYVGLNSLSAIKAAALITERTGKTLSTMDILRKKTPELIAKCLTENEDFAEEPFEKQELYPLTANQTGLYFAIVKDPSTLKYNIPFDLTFDKETDAGKLREALIKVIYAHPYINTHFVMKGGRPMQLRVEDMAPQVPITECGEDDFIKARQSFVRPFNFFEGPLYRIELYKTPDALHALCDFHHIVFDGGSMDIFLRDLTDSYNGKALEPESYTSFDLALSQEKKRGGASKDRHYFQEILGDATDATILPSDKYAREEGTPDKVAATLADSGVSEALKSSGVTPSNLFLAASALVISRFASTENVRIASISNGRQSASLQNNFGMLVKTQPAAIDVNSDLSAGEYVKYVQQNALDTLSHDNYTYMELSSDFGYDAQIMYAYQGGVISDYNIGGRPVEISVLELDKVKFPISINIQFNAGQYGVEAEYDGGLYTREYMEAFIRCIAYTAKQLAENPSAQLRSVCVSTPEQLNAAKALRQPIPPAADYGLNAVFEKQAQKTPDAPALYAAEGEYTYMELNEKAAILADALIDKGVKRGDRVAFMLPRTGKVIISMLGIMKTGAAYIPIDPDYPEDRVRHILEDSKARYILTEDGAGDSTLNINELLKFKNGGDPKIPVSGEDICYIIYTSGSTGKPKGVAVTHSNIINYVENKPENRQVRALVDNNCSMVSVTTVSFDMFLKEAFTTLMNGLRLILADDNQSKNPADLAELFEKSGGDAFNATPSRMLQYMELPAVREAFSKCKVIMAGGEAYPPALYDKLREITDAVLINTYGPTEITVSSNAKILVDGDINIGAPLYGVVEQITDFCGKPLPIRATGELWIGGNGVAKGYFGNEKLTEERFVLSDGVRWYKSGDVARCGGNGEITVLGRNDGQIKLRGLRIELGEIENAIASQPDITGSLACVKEINGQQHLCAYYTALKKIEPEILREALSKVLTKYMVPTAYLQLDAFPMTPNGKIDRKALPAAHLMKRAEYEPPQNETEEIYCSIFADILKLDRVGATDNFFDLGGSSLLVTQVTIDADRRGLKLSYGDVFANPTPRELAALGKNAAADITDNYDAEIADFDYSEINRLLAENDIAALESGDRRELGNVCITGATGFLGAHVLWEFIHSEKGAAYCLVRGGAADEVTRLKGMLVYYFSDALDELFGSRIIVINGDVTDRAAFDKLKDYPIDTFINCAANVKHFSAGTDIEDVNIGGAKNAAEFCKEKRCRLIQISTVSVAGMSVDGIPPEETRINERELYFGQDLTNKYTRSKFLAERLILSAAADGLDAKIMRVGNLMARASDGEFQANFKTNNFLSRLKAYSIVGRVSYSDMGANTEFAPIDMTAKAILKLSQTPYDCRVFHPYNDHSVYMGDVIKVLNEQGVEIVPCGDCEYLTAYKEAMLNKDKAKFLNSLIAYQEYGRKVVPIKSDNYYTSQALLRFGFQWPITTPQYLNAFFEMMAALGFFDKEI